MAQHKNEIIYQNKIDKLLNTQSVNLIVNYFNLLTF